MHGQPTIARYLRKISNMKEKDQETQTEKLQQRKDYFGEQGKK